MSNSKDKPQLQNLPALLKEQFLTIRNPQNDQAKKIISCPDLQVGLKDEKYPSRGIVFPNREFEGDVTDKLYNKNGILHFDGSPLLTSASTGDITSVTAGTGLSGGGTSGDVTLDLDVSELTALGSKAESSDYVVIQDSTDNSTKKVLVSNLPGDISSVIAGNGLLGGGDSGDVTLEINDSITATISGSQFSGNVGITPRLSVTGSLVVGNSSPGLDTHFFVSGSKGNRGTSNGNISVFAGDLVVSGTFYAEKMVIEVDETVTGSLMISGSLIVSQSAEIQEGLVVNSSGECGAENDFRVQSDNFTHALFVDTCADRVLVLSGGAAASNNESNSLDVNFFVSGTVGSRSTTTKGTSLFGGDMVVSGAMQVGAPPTESEDGSTQDFTVNTKDSAGIVYVNGNYNYIQFQTSDSTGQLNPGQDTFFHVSGTIGGKENTGVSVFGGDVVISGSILPGLDITSNLGSDTHRFANIYTGDLHLRNERGHWTIVEEADYLTVINNLTGKKYKMVLEPIDE